MNNNFLRRLRVESLETRILLAGDCFQNPINHLDVNADGVFNMGDTRTAFVGLNSDDVPEGEHIETFNDVNGDGSFNVGDLRSLLDATYMHVQQDIHSALDQAYSQVSSALDLSDLLSALDDIPNVELPSEVWDALSDAQNTIHNIFDDIASDISSDLSHAAHVVDDALDDLEMAVSNGLENSGDILSSIESSISSIQSQVNQDIQDAIDQVLENIHDATNGDNHGDNHGGSDGGSDSNGSSSPFEPLAGPIADFLDTLGVDDLSGQIEDFIAEVESGQVTLSSDAQYVYDLVADGIADPTAITSLVTADQDRLRQGAIDILDAFENSGRELPDVAIDLRSDLIAGESLLSIYVGLLTSLT